MERKRSAKKLEETVAEWEGRLKDEVEKERARFLDKHQDLVKAQEEKGAAKAERDEFLSVI